MFSDFESAKDLYDERITCFAEKRNEQSLAEAIIKWYMNDWDKDYIIEFSKYFSMERMAKDYIDYYEKRLFKR